MDPSTEQITAAVRAFSDTVRGKYPVRAVFLFGSWAEGRGHMGSDIDIGIVVEDSAPKGAHFDLYSLGKDYNIDFDVVVISRKDFETEDPLIVHEIKTKGILVA
jgi:predicted nucleotidyltransferase